MEQANDAPVGLGGGLQQVISDAAGPQGVQVGLGGGVAEGSGGGQPGAVVHAGALGVGQGGQDAAQLRAVLAAVEELVQRAADRCGQSGDVKAGCGGVDHGAGVGQPGGGHARDQEVTPGGLGDDPGQPVAQLAIGPVGLGGGPGEREGLVGLSEELPGHALDIGVVEVSVVVEVEQMIVGCVVDPEPLQQAGLPGGPLGGQGPGGDHGAHPRAPGQLLRPEWRSVPGRRREVPRRGRRRPAATAGPGISAPIRSTSSSNASGFSSAAEPNRSATARRNAAASAARAWNNSPRRGGPLQARTRPAGQRAR